MTTTADTAALDWTADDVPVSTRFDDPYYARQNGLAESRHVFLAGNTIAERLASSDRPLRIAELGFGTGLNILATIALRDRVAPACGLIITSFERYPLTASQIARAVAAWPELADLAQPLIDCPTDPVWPGVRFALIRGDVRTTLGRWHATVDAWFLDGFAPARNPQMWQREVLAHVYRRTAPGGTFATYTAAGQVRRDLVSAGFAVEKVRGYGTKREMLRGHRPAAGEEPAEERHGDRPTAQR